MVRTFFPDLFFLKVDMLILADNKSGVLNDV